MNLLRHTLHPLSSWHSSSSITGSGNTATTSTASGVSPALQAHYHHAPPPLTLHAWNDASQLEQTIHKRLMESENRMDASRHRTVFELRSIVEIECIRLSGESCSQLLYQLFQRLFSFLNVHNQPPQLQQPDASVPMYVQRGSLELLDELLDLDAVTSNESLLIRTANILRQLLTHATNQTDSALLHAAASVLGHLARVPSPLTAELVNFQVQQAFEWLEVRETMHPSKSDGATQPSTPAPSSSTTPPHPLNDARELAAVLVLKEMAANAPTLFNVYVELFLDAIWSPIRSSRHEVREAAILALRVCLIDISTRAERWRKQCWMKIFSFAQLGLIVHTQRKNSHDTSSITTTPALSTASSPTSLPASRVHGSLLAFSELLEHASSEFLLPRFRVMADLILAQRHHTNPFVRRSVIISLPKTARLNPEEFMQEFLQETLVYFEEQMDTEIRDTAFIALGRLSASMGNALFPFLPSLLKVISNNISATIGIVPDTAPAPAPPKSTSFFSFGKKDSTPSKDGIDTANSYGPSYPTSESNRRQIRFTNTALSCVSMLAASLKEDLAPVLPSILEKAFQTGLSAPLIDCASNIATFIPSLRLLVQDRLLDILADLLQQVLSHHHAQSHLQHHSYGSHSATDTPPSTTPPSASTPSHSSNAPSSSFASSGFYNFVSKPFQRSPAQKSTPSSGPQHRRRSSGGSTDSYYDHTASNPIYPTLPGGRVPMTFLPCSSRLVAIRTPVEVREHETALILSALRTIASFNFRMQEWTLLAITNDVLTPLLQVEKNVEIRVETARTITMLIPRFALAFVRSHTYHMVFDLLRQLLNVAVSDTSPHVRFAVVSTLFALLQPPETSQLLLAPAGTNTAVNPLAARRSSLDQNENEAQDTYYEERLQQNLVGSLLVHPECLTSLSYLLHDSIYSIRERVVAILSQLAPRNPEMLMPMLRAFLRNLLSSIHHQPIDPEDRGSVVLFDQQLLLHEDQQNVPAGSLLSDAALLFNASGGPKLELTCPPQFEQLAKLLLTFISYPGGEKLCKKYAIELLDVLLPKLTTILALQTRGVETLNAKERLEQHIRSTSNPPPARSSSSTSTASTHSSQIVSCMLSTLGKLSILAGAEMRASINTLLQLIVNSLQEQALSSIAISTGNAISGSGGDEADVTLRRTVAVRTLGQLIASTGSVIEPWFHYASLLPILVSFLRQDPTRSIGYDSTVTSGGTVRWSSTAAEFVDESNVFQLHGYSPMLAPLAATAPPSAVSPSSLQSGVREFRLELLKLIGRIGVLNPHRFKHSPILALISPNADATPQNFRPSSDSNPLLDAVDIGLGGRGIFSPGEFLKQPEPQLAELLAARQQSANGITTADPHSLNETTQLVLYEEYFPVIALRALLQILVNNRLAQLHSLVLRAILFIFRSFSNPTTAAKFLPSLMPLLLLEMKRLGSSVDLHAAAAVSVASNLQLSPPLKGIGVVDGNTKGAGANAASTATAGIAGASAIVALQIHYIQNLTGIIQIVALHIQPYLPHIFYLIFGTRVIHSSHSISGLTDFDHDGVGSSPASVALAPFVPYWYNSHLVPSLLKLLESICTAIAADTNSGSTADEFFQTQLFPIMMSRVLELLQMGEKQLNSSSASLYGMDSTQMDSPTATSHSSLLASVGIVSAPQPQLLIRNLHLLQVICKNNFSRLPQYYALISPTLLRLLDRSFAMLHRQLVQYQHQHPPPQMAHSHASDSPAHSYMPLFIPQSVLESLPSYQLSFQLIRTLIVLYKCHHQGVASAVSASTFQFDNTPLVHALCRFFQFSTISPSGLTEISLELLCILMTQMGFDFLVLFDNMLTQSMKHLVSMYEALGFQPYQRPSSTASTISSASTTTNASTSPDQPSAGSLVSPQLKPSQTVPLPGKKTLLQTLRDMSTVPSNATGGVSDGEGNLSSENTTPVFITRRPQQTGSPTRISHVTFHHFEQLSRFHAIHALLKRKVHRNLHDAMYVHVKFEREMAREEKFMMMELNQAADSISNDSVAGSVASELKELELEDDPAFAFDSSSADLFNYPLLDSHELSLITDDSLGASGTVEEEPLFPPPAAPASRTASSQDLASMDAQFESLSATHSQQMDAAEQPTDADGAASTPHGPKKLQMSQQNLMRAWTATARSTKDDWFVWMKGFSIELLKESPSPALRACSLLAQKFPPLSHSLMHAAFFACWMELSDVFQDDLINNLEFIFTRSNSSLAVAGAAAGGGMVKNASNSNLTNYAHSLPQAQSHHALHSVPSSIVATLLGLIESMEHLESSLPISIHVLGTLSERCQAFATSLHYREMEFVQNDVAKQLAKIQSVGHRSIAKTPVQPQRSILNSVDVAEQKKSNRSDREDEQDDSRSPASVEEDMKQDGESPLAPESDEKRLDNEAFATLAVKPNNAPASVSPASSPTAYDVESAESIVSSLISINNKLNQKSAADGILKLVAQEQMKAIQEQERARHQQPVVLPAVATKPRDSRLTSGNSVPPQLLLKPVWLERLHRWQDALEVYDRQQEELAEICTIAAVSDNSAALRRNDSKGNLNSESPVLSSIHSLTLDNLPPVYRSEMIEILLGKLRCWRSLGEWNQLASLAQSLWNSNEDPAVRRELCSLAACAAVNLRKWDSMAPLLVYFDEENLAQVTSSTNLAANSRQRMKYPTSLQLRHRFDASYYASIYLIHRNRFVEARLHIDRAAEVLDQSVSASLSESYARAYKSLLLVERLVVLEEIIEFKQEAQSANNNPLPTATAAASEAATPSHSGSTGSINSPPLTARQRLLYQMWSERIQGGLSLEGDDNVDGWNELLALQQLVNTAPSASYANEHNLDLYLQFCEILRKQTTDHFSLTAFTLTSSVSSSSGTVGASSSITRDPMFHHSACFAPSLKRSERILTNIIGFEPIELIQDLLHASNASTSNHRMSIGLPSLSVSSQRLNELWESIRPRHKLPHLLFTVWKLLYAEGYRAEAFQKLRDMVTLNQSDSAIFSRVANEQMLHSAFAMNSSGSSSASPTASYGGLNNTELEMLKAQCYLTLGKWQREALDASMSQTFFADAALGVRSPYSPGPFTSTSAANQSHSFTFNYPDPVLNRGLSNPDSAAAAGGAPSSSVSALRETLEFFRTATVLDPSYAKAWHEYAMLNAKVCTNWRHLIVPHATSQLAYKHHSPAPFTPNSNMSNSNLATSISNLAAASPNSLPTILSSHIVAAIQSFFRSISLQPVGDNSLQDILRILALWFEFGPLETTEDTFRDAHNNPAESHQGVGTPETPIEERMLLRDAFPMSSPSPALPVPLETDSSSANASGIATPIYPSIAQAMQQGIALISLDNWLAVIPQLLARIHVSNLRVRNLLLDLLMRLGHKHPQALVFPLTVVSKSPLVSRRNNALLVLDSLNSHSRHLISQGTMVATELVRVAIQWYELFEEGIQEASRAWFGRSNFQEMKQILQPLHEMLPHAQSQAELSFVTTYGRELNEAYDLVCKYEVAKAMASANAQQNSPVFSSLNPLYADIDPTRAAAYIGRAWETYTSVFRRLTKEIVETTQIELAQVSPKLLQARDLQVAVPGCYRAGDGPPVRISSFTSTLVIIESKQHPRRLSILGTDGVEYGFLLKGHEDLRQDERVMQLFGLVNTLLASDHATAKFDLNIRRFHVIPLDPTSGLIEWVQNTEPFHQVIKKYRDARRIQLNIEQKLMLKLAPDFHNCSIMQRIEAFSYALSMTNGTDLAQVFWLHAPNSQTWLTRRECFTRSTAVASIVGYIIGLGDRHTCNLLLDKASGQLVHIDFGDLFEVAQHREKFPERVPFRLTRMMTQAMELAGIEGTFRHTCEQTLRVIRKNKNSVMAVLEAFSLDPLLNWRLLTRKKSTNQAPAAASTTASTTLGGLAQQSQVPSTKHDMSNLIPPPLIGHHPQAETKPVVTGGEGRTDIAPIIAQHAKIARQEDDDNKEHKDSSKHEKESSQTEPPTATTTTTLSSQLRKQEAVAAIRASTAEPGSTVTSHFRPPQLRTTTSGDGETSDGEVDGEESASSRALPPSPEFDDGRGTRRSVVDERFIQTQIQMSVIRETSESTVGSHKQAPAGDATTTGGNTAAASDDLNDSTWMNDESLEQAFAVIKRVELKLKGMEFCSDATSSTNSVSASTVSASFCASSPPATTTIIGFQLDASASSIGSSSSIPVSTVSSSSSLSNLASSNDALSVPNQVQRLIEEATSLRNLSQAYIGWCPFW